MKIVFSRLVLLVGLFFVSSLFGQPERPGVAEDVARLASAPAAELLALCQRVIPPEERPEGDDTKERMVIYGLVMRAGSDPALRERLAGVFHTVLADEVPAPVKNFFLDQLQPIALPGCVPVAGRLLPDPVHADLAARVLVSVGGDEARAVLRGALPEARDFVRLTIVKALGELADEASVPALLELAGAEDRDLRLTVRQALAGMGDPRAAAVLRQGTAATGRYERAEADAAYLLFLRQLAARGQRAAAVEQALAYARERAGDAHIQCGVMEVCALAGEPAGVEFVLNGLLAEERRVRDAAAQALRALPTETITPRLLALLDQAPAAKQADVLLMLGRMEAAGAVPALKARLASPEESVRQAAIAALAQVAGKDAVGHLAPLLDGPDGAVVAASLAAVADPAVGSALIEQARNAPPEQAARMLALVAQRLDNEAPAVLALAGHEEARVRLAALQALAMLAGPAEISGLAALVARNADRRERETAARSLAAICRRTTDPALSAPPVLAALETAEEEGVKALLGVLPAIGDDTTLAAATAILDRAGDDLRREAVRALADWPDPAAVPVLQRIAAEDQDTVRYVFAFRGLARLVGKLDLPAEQRIARYGEIMALARRPDERRLVLAGLGGIRHRAVFPRLLEHIGDAELAEDAAIAIVELARAIKGEDAVAALQRVRAEVAAAQERATEALKEVAQFAGCVGVWEASGPYMQDNKIHRELYPIVFPPEERDAEGVVWRTIEADRQDGFIDFLPHFGQNNRCVYLRVNLVVPETTEALFEIGSDDGVKGWLNGNVVHENNVNRAFVPFEDAFTATLLEGTNTLMLKITQGGGGWAANARVRATDGTPLPGLNFEIGPPVYREATPQRLADGAPTAEELGWRLAIQCWSFRNFTFFEAVEKAERMGVKYLEMYPGQTVGAAFGDAKTGPDMPPDVQQAVLARLEEAGIRVVNYGVTGIPGDEAARRRLFDWAKSMGIETICSEPDPAILPAVDALCQEYGINLALHNHPRPTRYWNPQTVLDACAGRSERIGACGDTGHWMRSDIQPLEAVRLLEGRLITFHFKDLNRFGQGAHDVVWGTGEGQVIEVLRELRRQGVEAVFSIEFEHNWDHNETDIAACVRNFEAMARQIRLEEDGAWQVLFNMRDLDAFMNSAGDAPGAGWRIEGDELAMTGRGGYIWTRERFGDFVLELEYKTEGNSGLFFRTANPRDPVQTGIEMQVHRPANPSRHSVGSFYDLQAPSENAATNDWNHVVLTARDNRLGVTLNGVAVNEMDLDRWDTPGENPDGSKNKFTRALRDFAREGHIGFQDHGDPVRYRNIRIRRLD